ncbi:MAG: hypothetical protein ACOYJI_03865 [Anaerovoracaceae bacterium]|jgi:hypothetical protein
MKESKNRRSHKLLIIITAVLAVVLGSAAVYAATAGSESDPVVTKSYVDNAVANAGSGSSEDSDSGFQIVELSAGETLTGYQDTQIVLRSGAATAVIPGINGISDLTDGSDILNDEKIELNHLLMVPRSDGRGIKVSVDSFVMVKGAYTIGS